MTSRDSRPAAAQLTSDASELRNEVDACVCCVPSGDPRGAVCFFFPSLPAHFPAEKRDGQPAVRGGSTSQSIAESARAEGTLVPAVPVAVFSSHASPEHAVEHAPLRDAPPGIYVVLTTAAFERRTPATLGVRRLVEQEGTTTFPSGCLPPLEKNSSSVVVGQQGCEAEGSRSREETIGNGSGTAVTTMDQKRVYKLVLTGGT